MLMWMVMNKKITGDVFVLYDLKLSRRQDSTVFSGNQVHQMSKRNRCFKDHLGPHHQGCDDTNIPNEEDWDGSQNTFLLYIWRSWLPEKTLLDFFVSYGLMGPFCLSIWLAFQERECYHLLMALWKNYVLPYNNSRMTDHIFMNSDTDVVPLDIIRTHAS
jgi:hypothetical protein